MAAWPELPCSRHRDQGHLLPTHGLPNCRITGSSILGWALSQVVVASQPPQCQAVGERGQILGNSVPGTLLSSGVCIPRTSHRTWGLSRPGFWEGPLAFHVFRVNEGFLGGQPWGAGEGDYMAGMRNGGQKKRFGEPPSTRESPLAVHFPLGLEWKRLFKFLSLCTSW
jgi:hypothetical protein